MGMYSDLLHRIQQPAAAWNPVISRFCSFDRAVTLGSGRSLHKGGQGKLTLCHSTPHNCGVTKEVTNSLRRVANSCTRSLSTEVELGDIATVYTQKTCESPTDFRQWFVEAFSEFPDVNLGSGQNMLWF